MARTIFSLFIYFDGDAGTGVKLTDEEYKCFNNYLMDRDIDKGFYHFAESNCLVNCANITVISIMKLIVNDDE